MTRTLSAGRRLAHSMLLVALLLQCGAAVLGPWAHLAAVRLAEAPSWQADEPGAPAPAVHDEAGCVLCHTVGAGAFLATGSTAPLPTHSTDTGVPDPVHPDAASFVALPTARGPPLA